MNIYRVRRSYHQPTGGELNEIVVIAMDEKTAREVAAKNCGTEGPDFWRMTYATVDRLGVADINYLTAGAMVCRDVRS